MSKPVLSDPIALRLPEDILRDIETIAKASERTRSWVIVRALKYYLLAEGKDILEVLKGENDIREGRFVDAEVLFAELDRLNADTTSR
ncbi:CopG family ribbon-helix-helix protein [Rhizobium tubonense]|jgi:predicted transcriptional regulator|uniref:CopG family transcriptional regulator n=1 Tax=Rhizobium tubonense TaxID=484088 RepID=A0A2W4F5Y9_9HYPH|nr:ribbon-helix-helix protein, CopG family [Rhizobium tubonense]PZM17093.1 CopG family transcriptional regulator [Rhizobium tubonense]